MKRKSIDKINKTLEQSFLSAEEKDEIKELKSTSLRKLQINEVLYLFELAYAVTKEYPKSRNAFELAVKGMVVGLEAYKTHRLDKGESMKLTQYLTWSMRSTIETAAGIIDAPNRQTAWPPPS